MGRRTIARRDGHLTRCGGSTYARFSHYRPWRSWASHTPRHPFHSGRRPVSHSRHYPRALIAEFALVDTSWFLSPGHMPLVHRRQVRTDPVVLRLAAETAAAAGAFFLTFLTSSPVTEEPRQVVVPKVLQVPVPVPVGVVPAVPVPLPTRPNSRDPRIWINILL